jgi:hypothetical protein
MSVTHSTDERIAALEARVEELEHRLDPAAEYDPSWGTIDMHEALMYGRMQPTCMAEMMDVLAFVYREQVHDYGSIALLDDHARGETSAQEYVTLRDEHDRVPA